MIELSSIQKGTTYQGETFPLRHVLELWMPRIGKAKKRVKVADRQTDVEYIWVNDQGEAIGEPRGCMATTFATWAVAVVEEKDK